MIVCGRILYAQNHTERLNYVIFIQYELDLEDRRCKSGGLRMARLDPSC